MQNKKKAKFQNKKNIELNESQSLKSNSPLEVKEILEDNKIDITEEFDEEKKEEDDDYVDPSQVEVLTVEKANQLKANHKKIFRVTIADQLVLFTPISRKDTDLMYSFTPEQQDYINKLPVEEQEATIFDLRNDNLLRYFVVFPRRERVLYLSETLAGFVPTVSSYILQYSGFTSQGRVREL